MTENAIDRIRAETEKIGAETEKIILKFQETEEKFIYLTVLPFCEEVFERKISKQELEKILIDYKNGVSPVRHGEWLNKQGGFLEVAECSVCHMKWPTIGANYCPSCGAKMDGTSDNR